MGRLLILYLFSYGAFAHAGFRFEPTVSPCPAALGEGRSLKVLWQTPGDAGPMRELVPDDSALLGDDRVLFVLRFDDVSGAEAAKALFNGVMRAVGLPEGEEEPLGGGLSTGGPEGFVAGVYRDERDLLVAGNTHGDRVRGLDLLLVAATPEQRSALLGALRAP